MNLSTFFHHWPLFDAHCVRVTAFLTAHWPQERPAPGRLPSGRGRAARRGTAGQCVPGRGVPHDLPACRPRGSIRNASVRTTAPPQPVHTAHTQPSPHRTDTGTTTACRENQPPIGSVSRQNRMRRHTLWYVHKTHPRNDQRDSNAAHGIGRFHHLVIHS